VTYDAAVRFVLGNRLMGIVGGTETHLVTLGTELLRLGHEVVIYSPEHVGPFADHARQRGLDVLGEVCELPAECDVVFAQDGLVVYDLVKRYPQALTVFRICGDVYDFQSPPQLDGIVDLVVVLSERYARLAQACAVSAPLLRLRVPVDIDRLVPIGALRARPRRAVILGNYPDRVQVVGEAWERHGVEVRQVGGAQRRHDIADTLENADIVVAKSRAALDAMACGRAVYVYDTFGGDGWVTPETYPAMEADHFAGQATDRVIGAAELQRDIADYDPGMGMANRDLVLQHHNARDHTIEFLAAVTTRPPPERPPTPLRELSRMTALQWSWEHAAREAKVTQALLHDRLVLAEQAVAEAERARVDAHAQAENDVATLQADVVALHSNVAVLRAELDAIRASRAWRVADHYWRWRARLLDGG
jgi:hypothetical protein